MGIHYTNLDDAGVRESLALELEEDVRTGRLYVSPRLKDGAQAEYLELLRQSVRAHDDTWLAQKIRERDLLRTHESRKTKTGFTTAAVPVTAH